MITEDYVSFETAKLLKEKGFDCACKVWYSEYTSQFGGEKYTSIEFDNHNRFEENYKFICYAPTLQMAMKWLDEVHNIKVQLAFHPVKSDYGWYACLLQIQPKEDGDYSVKSHILPKTDLSYKRTCETAIKYCLENWI